MCVYSMCVCVRECEFSLVLLAFLAAKNRISQQQCASLHFVYIRFPMKRHRIKKDGVSLSLVR